MFRLNEQDDTQNYHLEDDGDPMTLQAFKDLYSERLPETRPSDSPVWNLHKGSSRSSDKARMEVGTLQSSRKIRAGVGSDPEGESDESEEPEGEGSTTLGGLCTVQSAQHSVQRQRLDTFSAQHARLCSRATKVGRM